MKKKWKEFRHEVLEQGTLENRLKNLINLYFNYEVGKPIMMIGFPTLICKDKIELRSRIKELADILFLSALHIKCKNTGEEKEIVFSNDDW